MDGKQKILTSTSVFKKVLLFPVILLCGCQDRNSSSTISDADVQSRRQLQIEQSSDASSGQTHERERFEITLRNRSSSAVQVRLAGGMNVRVESDKISIASNDETTVGLTLNPGSKDGVLEIYNNRSPDVQRLRIREQSLKSDGIFSVASGLGVRIAGPIKGEGGSFESEVRE